MRRVTLIAWAGITLSALAFPAYSATVNTALCPDGLNRAPVTGFPAGCPHRLFSGQVTEVADTTATVQVSTDVESGTAYAYLSASSTPPYWRTIKNSPTQSAAITGPTISFNLTGLPASSTRYLHFLARKTTGTISRIATVTINTQAGAGPGAPAEDYSVDGPASSSSTKYFIDSVSGNNGNTGLSNAQAWADFTPFLALNQETLPVGTDVWIKAGSSFAAEAYNRLIFKVNGSFANRARLACYYVDTGNSNAITDCRTGTLGGELDLDTGLMGTLEPWEIYGSIVKSDLLALKQSWKYPSDDCANEWMNLAQLTKSYQSFEGGRIRDSLCGGLIVTPENQPYSSVEGQLLYPVVRDSQFYRVNGGGLLLLHGVKYGLVQRMDLNRAGVCNMSYQAGGSGMPSHKFTYNSGGTTTVIPGMTLTSPSGGTARVSAVTLTSGSWAAGTAAGTIWFNTGDSFATTTPLNITVGGVADQFTTTQSRQASGSSVFCGAGVAGWPGGFTLHTSLNSYTVVDSSSVERTFTEQYNFYQSSKAVYRRLRAANGHSGGIYCDTCSDLIAEQNTFTTTKRNPGYPIQDNSNFGGGIDLGWEAITLATPGRPDAVTNNIVRNNILINTSIRTAFENEPYALGKQFSAWILGNTIVGGKDYGLIMNTMTYGFGIAQNNLISGKAGTGYDFTYPSWYTSSQLVYKAADCQNGTQANYNIWETIGSGTSFTNCTGANDVGRSGGVTQATATKIVRGVTNTNNADFLKALDSRNWPRSEDFELLDGSPARGAGSASWKTTKLISDADAAEYYKVLEPYTEINTPTKLLNWQMGLYYDFNGDERTTADLGALAYKSTIPPLTISADGRGFERDGKPFVYNADTAWHAQKLTQTQMRQYLDDRAEKGFNVIQGPVLIAHTVLFSTATNANAIPDSDGDQPLTSTSPVTLNNAFFTSIDYWVAEAAKRKLYVVLPLIWGSTADVVLTTNAQAYDLGKLVAQRYASSPNVIYQVMGEYHKIAWQTAVNDDASISAAEYTLIDNYAQGIEDYKHADQLITIHPNAGLDSTALIPEAWLDYSQVQSYQNQATTVDVITTHVATSPRMPTMDTEGSYEGGVTPTYSRNATAWVTRTFQYLSAFSGGAGAAYGAWDIWQFQTGWETAMALPGSYHAVRFADIMRRIGLENLEPAQSLVISGSGSYAYGTDTANRAMANSDSTRIAVYSEKGNDFTLNLPTKRYEMRWINPRNGDETLGSVFTGTSSTAFNPPNTAAEDNDWVLFLVEM